MTTYSSRFTPVLAADGGFAPLQLTVGEGTVLLSAICNIPDFCNSAWIQVPGPNSLGFRIDGDDTGVDFMTLPPLAFLPLTNRNELLALVLSAANGDTAIMIQFFQGSVGPMPPAPEVDNNGGVNPPPPPGSAADWRINEVYVMKNAAGNGGNNGTGTIERADLPFLDLINAQTAAQAGDTIVVFPGSYTVPTLGKDGVNWFLHPGAILTCASGPVFSANAITFEVRGFGQLINTDATAAAIAASNGGNIIVEAPVTAAGRGISCATDSDVVLTGDITADALQGVQCVVGRVTVNGQVSSVAAAAVHATNAASVVVINGDVFSVEDTGALAENGSMVINGDAGSDQGTGSLAGGSATLIVEGNSYSNEGRGAWTTGAGATHYVGGDAVSEEDSGAVADAGTQYIHGRSISRGIGNAAYCGDAEQTIDGDVIHEGTGPALNINVSTGVQKARANVIHTGTGFACSNISGNQLVLGDVTGTSTTAVHVAGADAVSDIRGDVTTTTDAACSVLGGAKLTLRGIITGPAGSEAVVLDDGTSRVVLLASAYLASDNGGINVGDLGGGGVVQSNFASGTGTVAGSLGLTGGSIFTTIAAA